MNLDLHRDNLTKDNLGDWAKIKFSDQQLIVFGNLLVLYYNLQAWVIFLTMITYCAVHL